MNTNSGRVTARKREKKGPTQRVFPARCSLRLPKIPGRINPCPALKPQRESCPHPSHLQSLPTCPALCRHQQVTVLFLQTLTLQMVLCTSLMSRQQELHPHPLLFCSCTFGPAHHNLWQWPVPCTCCERKSQMG